MRILLLASCLVEIFRFSDNFPQFKKTVPPQRPLLTRKMTYGNNNLKLSPIYYKNMIYQPIVVYTPGGFYYSLKNASAISKNELLPSSQLVAPPKTNEISYTPATTEKTVFTTTPNIVPFNLPNFLNKNEFSGFSQQFRVTAPMTLREISHTPTPSTEKEVLRTTQVSFNLPNASNKNVVSPQHKVETTSTTIRNEIFHTLTTSTEKGTLSSTPKITVNLSNISFHKQAILPTLKTHEFLYRMPEAPSIEQLSKNAYLPPDLRTQIGYSYVKPKIPFPEPDYTPKPITLPPTTTPYLNIPDRFELDDNDLGPIWFSQGTKSPDDNIEHRFEEIDETTAFLPLTLPSFDQETESITEEILESTTLSFSETDETEEPILTIPTFPSTTPSSFNQGTSKFPLDLISEIFGERIGDSEERPGKLPIVSTTTTTTTEGPIDTTNIIQFLPPPG